MVGRFRGSSNSQKLGLEKRKRKAKELLTREEEMWEKPRKGRSGTWELRNRDSALGEKEMEFVGRDRLKPSSVKASQQSGLPTNCLEGRGTNLYSESGMTGLFPAALGHEMSLHYTAWQG